jgi:hypothetical protein
MGKYSGWIEVRINYDIDALNEIDARIKLQSAVNRIKHLPLDGVPEVIDWGIVDAE